MRNLGVIFDFNGTLFWDSDKHEKAWKTLSKNLRGNEFSDEELQKYVHGRTNKSILQYMLRKDLDDENLAKLSNKKEQIYRDMCKEDIENFKLAPGAIKFLNYIKEKKISCTIATASQKENLMFFWKSFKLDKWFDLNKIVYDDGSFLGKPEPDIYLKAAKILGINTSDCIVIEDAFSGIESAYRAKIGKIIAIAPKEKHEYFNSLETVNLVITDFNDLDKNILNKE
ncbi:HAD family phosphatase [Clostridium sp. SHJSY1]|uniref:HAD family hydrolase n=1 Tax=Clostridium sp. SHJSY1 TaxID=2942483 RepID=UPI002875C8A7|nr:HAD family phosphatase [Clostridium sp. SHJSY1]MDS0524648.1 HAD family phosphatase [Clostridium sp. SHJSY1]